MKTIRIRLLFSLLALLPVLPAMSLADEGAGVAAADFLEVPVGARDIALGGATGSLPGDLAGLFRNPALLAGDSGHRIHLGHQEWFQGLQHESAVLGFALPGNLGRAALHARYLHLEPLPVYDAGMELAGEVDVYDLAYGFSWARRFHRRFDLGLNLHGIRQYLAGDEGKGWAGDLGLGFVGAGFYWSAAMRNLAGGVDFDTERFDLDREFSLGAARYFPLMGTVVSVEYRQPRLWGSSFRGGAEYMLSERLVLRAGYSHTVELDEAAGQPSFGAGLQLGGMGLDYSFRSHDHLGEVHSISIRLLDSRAAHSPYRHFRPSI